MAKAGFRNYEADKGKKISSRFLFFLPTPACDIPNIPGLICSKTHGIPAKL